MKTCLRCGIEKDESEFHKDAKKKDGLKIYCKQCVNQYNREHQGEVREQKRQYAAAHREQAKEANRRYRERHREALVIYQQQKMAEKRDWVRSFRQPCVKCGDNRLYVVDYHHIDPSEKKINLGSFSKGYASKSAIQEEIKKCICLCRNCHAEFHWLYGTNPVEPVKSLEEYLGRNPYDLTPNCELEGCLCE